MSGRAAYFFFILILSFFFTFACAGPYNDSPTLSRFLYRGISNTLKNGHNCSLRLLLNQVCSLFQGLDLPSVVQCMLVIDKEQNHGENLT